MPSLWRHIRLPTRRVLVALVRSVADCCCRDCTHPVLPAMKASTPAPPAHGRRYITHGRECTDHRRKRMAGSRAATRRSLDAAQPCRRRPRRRAGKDRTPIDGSRRRWRMGFCLRRSNISVARPTVRIDPPIYLGLYSASRSKSHRRYEWGWRRWPKAAMDCRAHVEHMQFAVQDFHSGWQSLHQTAFRETRLLKHRLPKQRFVMNNLKSLHCLYILRVAKCSPPLQSLLK